MAYICSHDVAEGGCIDNDWSKPWTHFKTITRTT
jgi:hypothetical protein